MTANEQITKAAQTAELLTQDLRELHRRFFFDNPTSAERLAEQHALALLNQAVALLALALHNQAVALHRELKGIES